VRSRTDEAREIALRLVEERPGIQQRDLVADIQQETDLATSTVTRLLQRLERDGVLEGRLDGRRKAYAVPGASAPPTAPARTRAEPKPAAPTSPGGRGELVAVVTALFIAASLVAFVLAPNKNDSSGGASSAAPAASPAPPPSASTKPAAPRAKAKPKPKPAPSGGRALAAAKSARVAVLSGSPVPGIAARTGAALKRKGFRVGTVGNAPGPAPRSVVLYARGKKGAARALARSAGIRAVRPADPAAQAMDPKAGLLVVVGADRQR
jgi:hypothetical protein